MIVFFFKFKIIILFVSDLLAMLSFTDNTYYPYQFIVIIHVILILFLPQLSILSNLQFPAGSFCRISHVAL